MGHIVTIKDYYGEYIKVEVSKEVFAFYLEEKNKIHSQNMALYRHRTYNDVEDDLTQFQNFHPPPSLEDYYLICEDLRLALEIIGSCTKVQQRRFYQNRIQGYSFVEIAQKEGRSESSIYRSIVAVENKLKKFF